jgi:hypothetical protein
MVSARSTTLIAKRPPIKEFVKPVKDGDVNDPA